MTTEWYDQDHRHNQSPAADIKINNDGAEMFVKVMTDEQLETLRQQIAVYASICDNLVEMHKTLTAQQDLLGGRLGHFYCDSLTGSAGHRLTSRQRWTPTPIQLQILETIFDQGTGTPSKQKIKEIATELSQHGQISEANVYNWFQNRRARSKRKQAVSSSNNAESEVEPEEETKNENVVKPEDLLSHLNPDSRAEDLFFQNMDITADQHLMGVISNSSMFNY